MKVFLPIFFLLGINYCFAQNTIGLPQIINFSNQDFHGGTQTWGMKQAKDGIMYFANNDGLLSFDGNYWRQYALPNKTIARCLAIDSLTGRIYVGSQSEFGYFSAAPNDDLFYTSLKKLIPEKQRDFSEIWHVEIWGNAVFFRANKKIFEYRNNTIQVFAAPSEWRFMKRVGEHLFAQDRDGGIMEFKNNSWQNFCNHPVLKDGLVTGILNYDNDTLLVTTLQNGVFLLHDATLYPKKTEADPLFASTRIYSTIKVNKDEFAIGTTSGGCFIIDTDGKLVQTISRTEGLQNNYVLCLFLDKSQNLWMGLDNGIDFVAYNTPIKRILPDKNNQLSGYAIKIVNKQLYIGTSDGLYDVTLDFSNDDLSFSKGNFAKVANTNGQVWRVDEINKQVLMGHHDGTFIINNNQAVPVIPNVGSWLFAQKPITDSSSQIIIGSYNGLQLLQKTNNGFVNNGKIEGLNESLRFLAIDEQNTVWASHPYKGVYKIRLSANSKSLTYKLFTQKDGLPSSFNNFVFYVKGKVVVATPKGIYEYEAASDRFVISSFFTPIFKSLDIEYLTEDTDGNIWFISSKKIGVVDYHKPTPTENFSILYFPELTNKLVNGFEYIYPYNLGNVFVGAEKGVYHINYKNYSEHVSGLNMLLRNVRITGKTDSLIYGGYFDNVSKTEKKEIAELPNAWNSIHFEYACPLYGQQVNIEYSYQLVGFDDKWSAWTKKTEKDYTNLHDGSYTFNVKARSNLGDESKPVSYSFKIKPAWYQTGLAYLFYLLLLFTAIYFFVKWQKKKFTLQQLKYAREQEHLRYMHQLEMDRNEKEIIKLQNEKLGSDVEFKNKELANATIHLVERGKVISKIKDELVRFQKNSPVLSASQDFKKIINLLSDAEKNDTFWEQFVGHFDQVHGNYLTILRNKYPSLSATDLKLCAYLRVNLSSKEISQMMNISVRGVEIARYRLRKKLDIKTDENLSDFLIALNGK